MRNISWRLREAFGDPIGSYAGDAPVGVRSIEAEGSCECGCVGTCGCNTGMDDEMCNGCGMPVDMCRCSYSGECPNCGQMPVRGTCGCPMSEAISHEVNNEVCSECGMMEIDGACECSQMAEGKLQQVTPTGYEKIVRALKKEPSVRNPWAVAWSMKSKGIRPKRKKRG